MQAQMKAVSQAFADGQFDTCRKLLVDFGASLATHLAKQFPSGDGRGTVRGGNADFPRPPAACVKVRSAVEVLGAGTWRLGVQIRVSLPNACSCPPYWRSFRCLPGFAPSTYSLTTALLLPAATPPSPEFSQATSKAHTTSR
jgi:hypothetical protein